MTTPPLTTKSTVTGKRLSPAHSRLLIGCCWAYALLFACSPLLHWGAYGPEPYGTACCIDWRRSRREAGARSYTLALLLLCYAAPCCVMLLSYGHILLTVRESRRAVEQHAVSAATRRTGSLQAVILKVGSMHTVHTHTHTGPALNHAIR